MRVWPVLFGKQELFLNGRSYPLGQFATDFLNLDERELSEIEQRTFDIGLWQDYF